MLGKTLALEKESGKLKAKQGDAAAAVRQLEADILAAPTDAPQQVWESVRKCRLCVTGGREVCRMAARGGHPGSAHGRPTAGVGECGDEWKGCQPRGGMKAVVWKVGAAIKAYG